MTERAIIKSKNNGNVMKLHSLGHTLQSANTECRKLNNDTSEWNYYPQKISKVAKNNQIEGNQKAKLVSSF